MADNISKYNRKRKAEQAIASAELLQEEAMRALVSARLELKKLDRPQSPGDGRYGIDICFEKYGITYTFLFLIKNGKVYTTATKNGGLFPSFDAFIAWIEGEKPYSTSNIHKVTTGICAVDMNL